MGDALLKQVTPKGGGGSNSLVAVFWGIKDSTDSSGEGDISGKTRYSCDPDYFTYSSNVFTAVKSFKVTVQIIGRSNYTSSGSVISASYNLYYNGVSVLSDSINMSGGGLNSINLSLSGGDTLTLKMTRYARSVSGGFYVEVV